MMDIFKLFFGPRKENNRPPWPDESDKEIVPFGSIETFNPDVYFQQAEEFFKQMMAEFHNFSSIEMPSFPELPGAQPYQPSLRDYMLKQPDSDTRPHSEPQQPNRREYFWQWPKQRLQMPDISPQTDTDLDDEISKGDFRALIPAQPPSVSRPGSVLRGSSSTYSFRSVNGVTEEKQVVKDSSGNEHVTVTRRIGDKTHTITTKYSATGLPEVTENFINMDEKDKEDFKRRWPRDGQEQTAAPPGDPSMVQIFKNLFGSNFNGRS